MVGESAEKGIHLVGGMLVKEGFCFLLEGQISTDVEQNLTICLWVICTKNDLSHRFLFAFPAG